MKVSTRYFVCGVTCHFGDKNCNNYCNHDPEKPMPDGPGTYQDLTMDEKDMWNDVIEILASYIPNPGEKTIFEILTSKYSIKPKE